MYKFSWTYLSGVVERYHVSGGSPAGAAATDIRSIDAAANNKKR